MNYLILLFTFGLSFSLCSQERGSLIHFQKNCSECLALAGEEFKSSKFQIMAADSDYSGGRIAIKKIENSNFHAKKALFLFDSVHYIKSEFQIIGKKNIQAYRVWEAQKVKSDPSGNSSFRLINGQQVIYKSVLKGRKLLVNIELSSN